MNKITKWYEHPLYLWMDSQDFMDMSSALARTCGKEQIDRILEKYNHIRLEEVNFYPAGTYSEPEKTTLDNIPDFYEIRMSQYLTPSHTGSLRIYLPVKWNGRYMGIAGAGTNNEVDWFTSVTFNVLSWPMALKNGYACAVSDNDTGIRLDCSWGFNEKKELEWDLIEAWVHKTLHETTVCAKDVARTLYGRPITASYMHGTSGGGRQVLTEALFYPDDFDGLWADGPAVDYLDLQFACLWAAVVEANENHIVPISKFQAAFDLATSNPATRGLPFDSREIIWMDFLHQLTGRETEDGPISRRDIQVMTRIWDGPFTKSGKRMAYGFGPGIRQWPLKTDNQLYGYLKRTPAGKLVLMPISEQTLRWFTRNPDLDIHSCSYEQYEHIYLNCRRDFNAYDFNEADFTAFAARGGKLMITHGTGDCVVPFQGAIDYYQAILDHFPSEKMMKEAVRLYMPDLAGHSILDWSGPAVSIADGMKALTLWTEKGQAPDTLPVVRYDFSNDRPQLEGQVEAFDQWQHRKELREKFK